MKKRAFFLIIVAIGAGFLLKNNVSQNLPRLRVPFIAREDRFTASIDAEFARVLRVIDGDTIELQNSERVRYIGMDAPEVVDPEKPVQCFGVEASERNKALVEGKLVRLEKDVSERDKYGRLLRVAYLPGATSSINLELVIEGYARVFTDPPDVRYASEFLAAEKEARAAKRGLWGACPS